MINSYTRKLKSFSKKENYVISYKSMYLSSNSFTRNIKKSGKGFIMSKNNNVIESEGIKAISSIAKKIPYKAISFFAIDLAFSLLEPITPRPWMGMLDGYDIRVAWKD